MAVGWQSSSPQEPAATLVPQEKLRRLTGLGPGKTPGVRDPPELGQSILALGSSWVSLRESRLSQRLWATGKGGNWPGHPFCSFWSALVKVPFEVSLEPPGEGGASQFSVLTSSGDCWEGAGRENGWRHSQGPLPETLLANGKMGF